MLEFPSAGTFNYSEATFDQDLTSFTVSFWMQTDDKQNQGTPFSYASSDAMDNALTMTSYDGSVSDFRTGFFFFFLGGGGSWSVLNHGLSFDQTVLDLYC